MYRILKLKESEHLKEADGWIAFYNGNKVEITKDEANDLWGAKQVAIQKLNVPKSKTSLVAVEPAYNESQKLKENNVEEYWDATEIDGRGFVNLMKFNFGTDSKGNNYIVTNDNNEVARFRADNDEEAKKKFKEEFLKESTLTEADEEVENIEKAEETEEDLEDTLDSEEDQEENPVEEESELDKELDEIREVLVDLDLRLYKIMNNEEEFYIIGRLDPESNQVEMLVDTQPAPEENVDILSNGEEESEKVLPKEEEIENIQDESNIATRFDYVKLPNKFEQIKDMFPRYGEGLTPDHEAIMEYLMNLLIEQNPRAVEEKAEEIAEEVPEEIEDIEVVDEIPGEEEIEDEEK